MRNKVTIFHNSIHIISSRADVGAFILNYAWSKILASQLRNTATTNGALSVLQFHAYGCEHVAT